MYGHNFRYEEGMYMGPGAKGAIGANVAGFGLSVMNSLPRFKPVRQLMQRFLPKPGEGPSPELVENGFFEVEIMAKGASPGEDIRASIKGKRDPGYGAKAWIRVGQREGYRSGGVATCPAYS